MINNISNNHNTTHMICYTNAVLTMGLTKTSDFLRVCVLYLLVGSYKSLKEILYIKYNNGENGGSL